MDTGLTLYGLAVIPAILGIVQLAKKNGLPGRYAPLAAIALGVLAAAAEVYKAQLPWLPYACEGIALALTSMGLYDLSTTSPTYLQGVMALVTAILTKQSPQPPIEPGPAAPSTSTPPTA